MREFAKTPKAVLQRSCPDVTSACRSDSWQDDRARSDYDSRLWSGGSSGFDLTRIPVRPAGLGSIQPKIAVNDVRVAAGAVLQRACREESFYRSSPNYCRDDTFSPTTHPGKTCYRQIPSDAGYFSCPPGEHVCFDGSGNCEDSPDRSSLAEGRESDGSCNWNAYCVAEHTAVDFVPAVAEEVTEPFTRELRKALDWRNWLPLAGY